MSLCNVEFIHTIKKKIDKVTICFSFFKKSFRPDVKSNFSKAPESPETRIRHLDFNISAMHIYNILYILIIYYLFYKTQYSYDMHIYMHI